MGRRRNKPNSSTNPGAILGLKSELLSCDVSPIYGRYLKSKVDIKKGTIVLKEKYLVAGPKLNSTVFCVGCHSEVNESRKGIPCQQCKWPLCDERCGTASPFHAGWECKFLQEHKIEPPDDPKSTVHGCITILRCLALKLQPQPGANWQKFACLQSHVESRRQIPELRRETELVIRTICQDWKLGELFTPEEVENACGAFEVNSFEMGDCFMFGGIFPISAMCAHDCIPNCSQNEIVEEKSLEIRAMVDLPAGTALTLCYDECLKGTRVRQAQLNKSKHFDCTCERCKDPTELGTHFSTLLCQNCKKGSVTLVQAEGAPDIWKCNKCQHKINDSSVEQLVRKYSALGSAMVDIKSQEEFLAQCKPIFHANHFVPFGVKYNLCMAYGREGGYGIEELTSDRGHRKLELCQEVMKVCNILTPGLSISRGNILYEQQAAEVLIAKNLLDGGRCSKGLVKARLNHAIGLLEEAIEIFDMNYATQMLAEAARNTTLKELRSWLATLK